MRSHSLFFISLISTLMAHGQVASISRDVDVATLDLGGDVKSWYDAQVGLINTAYQLGTHYKVEVRSRSTNPFWFREWQTGYLEYQGQSFERVMLMYDMEKDALLVRNAQGGGFGEPMELNMDLVASFQLADASFVYLENQVGLANGYYQKLREGEKLSLYAKRVKVLSIVDSEVAYILRHQYFLKKDGEFISIRNFRNYAKHYPEHKKQLKKHVGAGKRAIGGPAGDLAFIELVDYTESILP